jgi:quercetin dioxygenase-like cupin family protein
MEEEIDCKMASNHSRPAFPHFARKVFLIRTIFCTAGGLAVLLIAFAARSSDPSDPTQRVPQFENSHVKVWKSTIAPNAPLPLHRHDHGRVIIAVQGGSMKIVDQSGTSETQVWETGKAYWLPKNPRNTMHSDVNAGDHPIEVMVVEIEDDK